MRKMKRWQILKEVTMLIDFDPEKPNLTNR